MTKYKDTLAVISFLILVIFVWAGIAMLPDGGTEVGSVGTPGDTRETTVPRIQEKTYFFTPQDESVFSTPQSEDGV